MLNLNSAVFTTNCCNSNMNVEDVSLFKIEAAVSVKPDLERQVKEMDKGKEGSSLVLRENSDNKRQETTSGLVLQWGNRKRLRCMKVQLKDHSSTTTVRLDRRVLQTDNNNNNNNNNNNGALNNNNKPTVSFNITNTQQNQSYGFSNLRQRPSSPHQRILRFSTILIPPPFIHFHSDFNSDALPSSQIWDEANSVYVSKLSLEDHIIHIAALQIKARIRSTFKLSLVILTRNSETSSAMRGVQSNGGVKGIASPDKRGTHNNTLFNDNNKSLAFSGGSPSGSGDVAPPVWPPKFVIALTNKEKEEDFLAIKGSKLPQRPKKRAKLVQRTLNQVSPGAWLCDLTLERYEVREKKINKKRPRGLKAMGNMDSESE
ncbi:hypothetical protein Lal_00020520 [Lupinus albus]|nr:hypothetical protein Lal_00020520 [Lupinus albus]